MKKTIHFGDPTWTPPSSNWGGLGQGSSKRPPMESCIQPERANALRLCRDHRSGSQPQTHWRNPQRWSRNFCLPNTCGLPAQD